jgi:hypothetical protein
VRSSGNFHMMSDSGFEAPGAEGTADIHVETGSDTVPAEFSHINELIGS